MFLHNYHSNYIRDYIIVLVFIEYILNPNPKERPGIFQVSYLSHQMLGRNNPIANIFVSHTNIYNH